MKSGTLPKSGRQAEDELVAGTEKDPTQLAVLPYGDPADAVSGGPSPSTWRPPGRPSPSAT